MLTGSIARVPTYPAAEATTTSAISELSFILSLDPPPRFLAGSDGVC